MNPTDTAAPNPAPLFSSKSTIFAKLPADFGLAESNSRFGHLDAVVPRSELRPTVAKLLRLFANAG